VQQGTAALSTVEPGADIADALEDAEGVAAANIVVAEVVDGSEAAEAENIAAAEVAGNAEGAEVVELAAAAEGTSTVVGMLAIAIVAVVVLVAGIASGAADTSTVGSEKVE